MRKLLTVAAALTATSVCNPAMAADCIANGTNSCFINYTTNVGGTFGNPDPITFRPHFQDIYNFTTTLARTLTIQLDSTYAGLGFDSNVNFIFNGVKINGTVIPATSTGVTEQRYLTNFRLPAGANQLFVSGSAGRNGTYTGILTLSGVPEPAAWATMILGLGLAGAAMRRKRRKALVAARA